MRLARRLVNMSTRARRFHDAGARVGMFASRLLPNQLSKNEPFPIVRKKARSTLYLCGRKQTDLFVTNAAHGNVAGQPIGADSCHLAVHSGRDGARPSLCG